MGRIKLKRTRTRRNPIDSYSPRRDKKFDNIVDEMLDIMKDHVSHFSQNENVKGVYWAYVQTIFEDAASPSGVLGPNPTKVQVKRFLEGMKSTIQNVMDDLP